MREKSGKSRGILRWMISGNPVTEADLKKGFYEIGALRGSNSATVSMPPFLIGVDSQRNGFAPRGANSFH